MNNKLTMLMILDGFGINENEKGNAVKLANTPNIDKLMKTCPTTQIYTSGMQVGLPDGQMGNSEVGHTNIGAGRIVYQELTKITKSIEDGDFFSIPELVEAIENCKKNHSKLHILGLLSDGGVHSHIRHLFALLELAKRKDFEDVYVHCFLDGRDTPPASGESYILKLQDKMKEKVVNLRECLYCLYRANDTYTLDILLKSKDFEDFLDKAEMVRSVSSTIKKLIDGLKSDLSKLNQKEQDLIKDKEEQETENKSLEESRGKLQDLLDKSESLLSDLEKSEQKVKHELDENDAEIKAVDEQIKKYYEEQKKREEEAKKQAESGKQPQKPSVVHKGGYVWPVPGFTRISSGFNDTQNRAHMHGAIDIAGRGIYGAKVVAAGAGKVIMANTDGRGGGYGNFVVLNHGNGFFTLYGHLSNVTVKAGQTVAQGEQVGNVGSTGFSTGPHLHFECRQNGVRVDPHIILAY